MGRFVRQNSRARKDIRALLQSSSKLQAVLPIGARTNSATWPTAAGQPISLSRASRRWCCNEEKKTKRSSQRDEAEKKLAAALIAYHRLDDDRGLILEPIVSNELARAAEVAKSSATRFFNKQFNKRKPGGTRITAINAATSRNSSQRLGF